MYILLRPPAQNRRSAVGFRNKGASRFSTAEVQISPPPPKQGIIASKKHVKVILYPFTFSLEERVTVL